MAGFPSNGGAELASVYLKHFSSRVGFSVSLRLLLPWAVSSSESTCINVKLNQSTRPSLSTEALGQCEEECKQLVGREEGSAWGFMRATELWI